MKLLLTSDGLTSNKLVDSFKKLLVKPLIDVKVLMISSGPEDKKDIDRKNKILGYIRNFEKPLIKVGVPENNFIVLLMSHPEKVNFNDFDVVFFCGGNTYLYLSLIKKLGLDKQIKDFVNHEGLYVGISAGSILTGPSIESAGIGKNRDVNGVGLRDLTGLGLVKFTILPHFNLEDRTEVLSEIKEAKLGYVCHVLNDGEAILVKGNTIKKV